MSAMSAESVAREVVALAAETFTAARAHQVAELLEQSEWEVAAECAVENLRANSQRIPLELREALAAAFLTGSGDPDFESDFHEALTATV